MMYLPAQMLDAGSELGKLWELVDSKPESGSPHFARDVEFLRAWRMSFQVGAEQAEARLVGTGQIGQGKLGISHANICNQETSAKCLGVRSTAVESV
jgi:hypothetical protein